ncbi:hypothetical protein GCM10009117_24570 [Gangjinia marincola]|uniref:AraC effector-binding domain-containing protein n=1 Tax=Gangjinia marincola TaxID=578463 RepID=A0ABN1MJC9_9FLAO
MKILKYIFFLLLIVVIGACIYFATKNGSYAIAEDESINAPKALVYQTVNELKTWEEWGPWKEEDPEMTFTYPEKTQGEGASYSWDGEYEGKIETISTHPTDSLVQKLMIQTPLGERISNVTWYFKETEDAIKTTWKITGEHPLIDKIFFGISGMDFDSQMSSMFTKGLSNLEEFVEEKMSKYTITVDGITDQSGGYYMYTTTAARQSAIPEKMAPMMQTVSQYMSENNIAMAGNPMTIVNEWDEMNKTAIFSAAIPVATRVITPQESPVLCGFMPAQKVLKATLKGDYKNLAEAWQQAKTYAEQNNLDVSQTSFPFEVYVTDPAAVANPANWITHIYIPLKAQEL